VFIPIISVRVLQQNDFRKGRSSADAIFTVKVITVERKEYNLETRLLFIDYEKAIDNVDRQKLFQIL
jgi:hypothetical protein